MSVTPRLKRLYLYKETSKQMRCHKEGKYDSEDPDIMLHPANGEAWQAVNRFDLEFARDHMSVCLGFLTHGFQPHNTDSSMYFCCPVFIMPYNLPLKKYLKQGFIFLTLVILGPKKPKKQMNIFLCLLMKELKEL
jgi:hypothetical protein